ncbi:hypothetical protein GCM10010981_33420 [Dyella nitratireducens]|uniref:Uncharacterized protein n=1 Tax=Dyella nitratireducens TaxID=1849580 RepID=A0ABQ1GDJ2_9GAMM|nr:hypothetical protein GCM10010981_33420 [Dyella nitratireducens]
MRHLVGAAVQLAVTQRFAVVQQGNRIRMSQCLLFKQLVDQSVGGIRHIRGIEGFHHLAAFGLVQQRQAIDGLRRISRHAVQNALELLRHPFDGRVLEQVAGVGEAAVDLLAVILQIQGQVEMRGACGGLERLQVQSGQIEHSARRVVHRQHHLEHRTMAETSRRLQRFDHLLEGHVLIGMCLDQLLLDAGQQGFDRRRIVQPNTQGRGVDEKADQRFQFVVLAVGGRHADHHVILAAPARQQHRPCCQSRHEQGNAMTLAELP